jgi:hypothetical protein
MSIYPESEQNPHVNVTPIYPVNHDGSEASNSNSASLTVVVTSLRKKLEDIHKKPEDIVRFGKDFELLTSQINILAKLAENPSFDPTNTSLNPKNIAEAFNQIIEGYINHGKANLELQRATASHVQAIELELALFDDSLELERQRVSHQSAASQLELLRVESEKLALAGKDNIARLVEMADALDITNTTDLKKIEHQIATIRTSISKSEMDIADMEKQLSLKKAEVDSKETSIALSKKMLNMALVEADMELEVNRTYGLRRVKDEASYTVARQRADTELELARVQAALEVEVLKTKQIELTAQTRMELAEIERQVERRQRKVVEETKDWEEYWVLKLRASKVEIQNRARQVLESEAEARAKDNSTNSKIKREEVLAQDREIAIDIKRQAEVLAEQTRAKKQFDDARKAKAKAEKEAKLNDKKINLEIKNESLNIRKNRWAHTREAIAARNQHVLKLHGKKIALSVVSVVSIIVLANGVDDNPKYKDSLPFAHEINAAWDTVYMPMRDVVVQLPGLK